MLLQESLAFLLNGLQLRIRNPISIWEEYRVSHNILGDCSFWNPLEFTKARREWIHVARQFVDVGRTGEVHPALVSVSQHVSGSANNPRRNWRTERLAWSRSSNLTTVRHCQGKDL